jgi:hypothetical protein
MPRGARLPDAAHGRFGYKRVADHAPAPAGWASGDIEEPREGTMAMPSSSCLRNILIATLALAGLGLATPASADTGSISFAVYKAGFFVGGSGGEGTLRFHGRRYRVSVGGVSAGLVFGASKTYFNGTVRHIRRASDVTGIYGAAGGGGALGVGAQAIVLRNEKGAVLELTGKQVGAQINVDLSGLSITVK